MRCEKGKLVMVGLTTVALLGWAVPGLATVNVTIDPGSNWIGYMNVFELPVGTGAYVFGSSWGTADLTAVFTQTGTLKLGPNTNVWDPTDPFWVNQITGEGAKWMNANMYVEDTSALGDTLVFSGKTIENSLVSGYTSQAFIKVLDSNAGYATVAEVYAPLVTGQYFSLSLAVDNVAGYIPQYGFVTDGADADPATVDTLGRVKVIPEPSTLALGLLLAGALVWRRR